VDDEAGSAFRSVLDFEHTGESLLVPSNLGG
jgi:hypothetical protein